MKKALLVFSALILAGCAAQQPLTANTKTQAVQTNSTVSRANSDVPSISSSHSTEQQQQSPHASPSDSTAAANPPSGSNGGRSPMERAIDTSAMDATIEKAAQDYKKKPNEASVKTALAEAYFARATALTEASQYRAALGDYRRGLKLDPTNADAKGMQDQIISIFQSLNREPPKEGTEPTPLPFKKI